MLEKINKYADYIGITGSTVCLIHCIATSTVAIFGLGAGHLHGEGLWVLTDVLLIAAGITAVFFAAKSTQSPKIKILLWFFMLSFIFFTLLKMAAHQEWIHYASYLASFGLIATHFENLRCCRRGTCVVRASSK